MALLVLLAATTWAFFVAPYLATLCYIIKAALLRRRHRTHTTGAGRFMAFIPISTFLSYYHGLSPNYALRLGQIEVIPGRLRQSKESDTRDDRMLYAISSVRAWYDVAFSMVAFHGNSQIFRSKLRFLGFDR